MNVPDESYMYSRKNIMCTTVDIYVLITITGWIPPRYNTKTLTLTLGRYLAWWTSSPQLYHMSSS
jgi:hypothetical protein